jgi:hypothetical protein
MNKIIKYTVMPLALAAAMLAEGCTINVTYTNNKDKSKTEIDNSQNKNQHNKTDNSQDNRQRNRTDNSQYIKDKSHVTTDSDNKYKTDNSVYIKDKSHTKTDNSQYIKDKSHKETDSHDKYKSDSHDKYKSDSHDKSIWYEKIISSFKAKFKKNHVTPANINNNKGNSRGNTGGLEKKVAETPHKPVNSNKTPDKSNPYNNQSTPYNNEQIPGNQEQPSEPIESDLQIKIYRMPVRTEVLGGYTNNPSFRTTTRPDDFDRMDYILSFPQ